MSNPMNPKPGRGIDHSPARATNFRVFISKFPNIAFYTTDAMVPAVNLPDVMLDHKSGMAFLSDNKVEFEMFTVGFTVDEYFESYTEIFQYFMNVASPMENREEVIDTVEIQVQALDNNKNPVLTFRLTDARPTALGQITYDTQDTENNQLVCDITFRYDTMKLERVTDEVPTGLDTITNTID